MADQALVTNTQLYERRREAIDIDCVPWQVGTVT